MDGTLLKLARQYASVIGLIESTRSLAKLKRLEESRVDLHWKLIEAFKQRGIHYRDRQHATRIALRIAREEE